MYILVEIIHTEFQYISLIEMQKYNWNRKRIEKRKTWKKRDILSRLPDPGQKGTPFCPGLAFPVGKPGQQGISQPGQINVFVVVRSNKNLKRSGLGWVIHQYVGRNRETFLNSCYCLWCGWSSYFERCWKMMLYFIFRFSSTLTFICIWKQSPRPFISPWHPQSRVRKNGV